MEINLKITKESFEQAVPVAREPKGNIFFKLEERINACIEDIADDRLGDVGIAECNAHEDGKLAKTVLSLASVNVFLHQMRDLDLVLTASGFGVVSTQNTAPASKMRVDALDGEMRVEWLRLNDELLELCFKLEGWYQQGLEVIDTLFCFFKLLKTFGGFQAPLAKDWQDAQTVILSTDRWLREKISDEYMDELVGQMATNSLTAPNKGIVRQIRRIIGVAMQGNNQAVTEYYRRLMNTLEGDLDTYNTYAGSLAFETNHFKPYENTEESGAFHFVG